MFCFCAPGRQPSLLVRRPSRGVLDVEDSPLPVTLGVVVGIFREVVRMALAYFTVLAYQKPFRFPTPLSIGVSGAYFK